MSTAVSKATGSFLAPSSNTSYGGEAQKLDSSHFAPPILNVLQKGSPQVEEDNAKYIDGAKAGDLHHTVTDEVFSGKDGVVIIPCAVDRYYTEWGPREEGGGYKGRHNASSEVVQAALRKPHKFGQLKNGANTLAETFVLYGVLYKSDEEFEPVIVPFTSTKITPYKEMIQKLAGIRQNGKTVAYYNHALRFVTKMETRAKGTSYNFDIDWLNGSAKESRLDPSSPLFVACKEFAEMATAGTVEVTEASNNQSDDIPF